jgi:hypothetical protein
MLEQHERKETHLEDPGVDGSIILKRIFETFGFRKMGGGGNSRQAEEL